MKYYVRLHGEEHLVELLDRLDGPAGSFDVRFDGRALSFEEHEIDGQGQVLLVVEGRTYGASVETEGAGEKERVLVTIAGHLHPVAIEDERERAAHAAERGAEGGGGSLHSVMPGVVVQVLVLVGEAVEAGRPLVVLEAMKMQNEIAAAEAGVVLALHVAPGEPVAAGAKLVTLGPPPA